MSNERDRLTMQQAPASGGQQHEHQHEHSHEHRHGPSHQGEHERQREHETSHAHVRQAASEEGEPSLPFEVLRVILQAYFLNGGAVSGDHVWDKVRRGVPWGQVPSIAVINALEALRSLGIVVRSRDAYGFERDDWWEPAPQWRMRRQGDEGDDSGGGGHGDGFSGNEDGGQRRFPEVLAHPILFALPPDDFTAMLDQMLEA